MKNIITTLFILCSFSVFSQIDTIGLLTFKPTNKNTSPISKAFRVSHFELNEKKQKPNNKKHEFYFNQKGYATLKDTLLYSCKWELKHGNLYIEGRKGVWNFLHENRSYEIIKITKKKLVLKELFGQKRVLYLKKFKQKPKQGIILNKVYY